VAAAGVQAIGFEHGAHTEQDYTGLLDAMLGKSAGREMSYEEVRGRVDELLQSPAWSRAWLAVLTTCPPADVELERAGARVADGLVSVGAWADHHHDAGGRMGAAEEDSREVSATDLQYCDWCGAGLLTMLKCGKCKLVYYCSIDCQRATWSQHKVACVPSATWTM